MKPWQIICGYLFIALVAAIGCTNEIVCRDNPNLEICGLFPDKK